MLLNHQGLWSADWTRLSQAQVHLTPAAKDSVSSDDLPETLRWACLMTCSFQGAVSSTDVSRLLKGCHAVGVVCERVCCSVYQRLGLHSAEPGRDSVRCEEDSVVAERVLFASQRLQLVIPATRSRAALLVFCKPPC